VYFLYVTKLSVSLCVFRAPLPARCCNYLRQTYLFYTCAALGCFLRNREYDSTPDRGTGGATHANATPPPQRPAISKKLQTHAARWVGRVAGVRVMPSSTPRYCYWCRSSLAFATLAERTSKG
jgi:hypothetical protein